MGSLYMFIYHPELDVEFGFPAQRGTISHMDMVSASPWKYSYHHENVTMQHTKLSTENEVHFHRIPAQISLYLIFFQIPNEVHPLQIPIQIQSHSLPQIAPTVYGLMVINHSVSRVHQWGVSTTATGVYVSSLFRSMVQVCLTWTSQEICVGRVLFDWTSPFLLGGVWGPC